MLASALHLTNHADHGEHLHFGGLLEHDGREVWVGRMQLHVLSKSCSALQVGWFPSFAADELARAASNLARCSSQMDSGQPCMAEADDSMRASIRYQVAAGTAGPHCRGRAAGY